METQKINKTKEQFIKSMLDKKAEENKIIDLNAYGIGLEEMYEALNLESVTNPRELLIKFLKPRRGCKIPDTEEAVERFVDVWM